MHKESMMLVLLAPQLDILLSRKLAMARKGGVEGGGGGGRT